jgi:hypothetical protein
MEKKELNLGDTIIVKEYRGFFNIPAFIKDNYFDSKSSFILEFLGNNDNIKAKHNLLYSVNSKNTECFLNAKVILLENFKDTIDVRRIF